MDLRLGLGLGRMTFLTALFGYKIQKVQILEPIGIRIEFSLSKLYVVVMLVNYRIHLHQPRGLFSVRRLYVTSEGRGFPPEVSQ